MCAIFAAASFLWSTRESEGRKSDKHWPLKRLVSGVLKWQAFTCFITSCVNKACMQAMQRVLRSWGQAFSTSVTLWKPCLVKWLAKGNDKSTTIWDLLRFLSWLFCTALEHARITSKVNVFLWTIKLCNRVLTSVMTWTVLVRKCIRQVTH